MDGSLETWNRRDFADLEARRRRNFVASEKTETESVFFRRPLLKVVVIEQHFVVHTVQQERKIPDTDVNYGLVIRRVWLIKLIQ